MPEERARLWLGITPCFNLPRYLNYCTPRTSRDSSGLKPSMLRRCGATAPSKRRAPGCAILRSFAKTRSCGTKAAYLGRFWVSLTGAAAFVVIAGSAVGFRFCPAKPSPAPGSDGRSTRGGTSVGSTRPDVVARKRKAASLCPSDLGCAGNGRGMAELLPRSDPCGPECDILLSAAANSSGHLQTSFPGADFLGNGSAP